MNLSHPFSAPHPSLFLYPKLCSDPAFKTKGLVEYQILDAIEARLDNIESCPHCQITCEWLDIVFPQMNQLLNLKILICLTYVIVKLNEG